MQQLSLPILGICQFLVPLFLKPWEDIATFVFLDYISEIIEHEVTTVAENYKPGNNTNIYT